MRETEAGRVTDATLLALEARRDGLYKRLDEQYGRVLTTVGAGEDTLAVEDEWIGLLKEYTRVCDEIQRGA